MTTTVVRVANNCGQLWPITVSIFPYDQNCIHHPSYIFQVSSKSVQGFGSCGGSKFAHSHYFGYWLLQQLALPCKPWWMEWMFVSLTTICHISPLCHSFIATLQLGLLDCQNSTRKCWNKLVLLIMRCVLWFIKVLKISRLFRQDQDQDQEFYFKTMTIFHVLEAPRDQDGKTKVSRLHPCWKLEHCVVI